MMDVRAWQDERLADLIKEVNQAKKSCDAAKARYNDLRSRLDMYGSQAGQERAARARERIFHAASCGHVPEAEDVKLLREMQKFNEDRARLESAASEASTYWRGDDPCSQEMVLLAAQKRLESFLLSSDFEPEYLVSQKS